MRPFASPFARLTAGLLALLVAASGCQRLAPVDEATEKAAVEATIRAYLPALGKAYASGNVHPLKTWAVDKEVSRVNLRVEELANQGRVYEPEFKDLTVENIKIWKYANAVVTTVEVWDVRSYALGSHTLLSAVEDQRNRVQYQLKKKDDEGWKVLYRELAQPLD